MGDSGSIGGAYEFMAGLTWLGWFGLAIPFGFIILVVLRPQWFWVFNYYERKPYIKAFDDYMYTDGRQIIFMIVRFVFMFMLSMMLMYLLTSIGTVNK